MELETTQVEIIDTVEAQYDCKGEGIGEIAFSAGNTLKVLMKQKSGWWVAFTVDDPSRIGFVPGLTIHCFSFFCNNSFRDRKSVV